MDEHRGIAIGSLVCGIVSTAISALAISISIFWSLWGCVIGVAGVTTGIVAIALGSKARYAYPTGRATAGFVLGIIGTALDGIICLGCMVVYILL